MCWPWPGRSCRTMAPTRRWPRASRSGGPQTASAFVAAAELYRGAQQNMAFATRSGSIGMISPGLVPIRRQGDGRLPVPGWTGTYDWAGTHPGGSAAAAARPALRPPGQRQQPPGRRRLPVLPRRGLGGALPGGTDRRAAGRRRAVRSRPDARRPARPGLRPRPRFPALPARRRRWAGRPARRPRGTRGVGRHDASRIGPSR